ncbi:MAG: hypothetical protein U0414_10220 [Polyangiaceae bacterium]
MEPRDPPSSPALGAPASSGSESADDGQRGDVVYIADASVEGEELASVLRARGYSVVDIPFALLESHVFTTPPRVLVLDVDQPNAVGLARRIGGSPIASKVHLVCVGDPARAKEARADAHSADVYERPVDVARIAERVSSLATPSGLGYVARGTTPPPMYASRPSVAAPPSDSAPPASDNGHDVDPLDMSSLLPSFEDGDLLDAPDALSPDLAMILRAAEERVAAAAERLMHQLVEEDPDCRVPVEMLSPLDEPLDALDEAVGTGSESDGTGSRQSAALWSDASASIGGLSQVSQALSIVGTAAQASQTNRPGKPVSDTSQASDAVLRSSARGDAGPATPSGEGVRRTPLPPRAALGSEPPRADGGPSSASSLSLAGGALAGFPFSLSNPASAPVAALPSPHTLALRRELSALRAQERPPLEDEAPVRFQEGRPIAEGRSAFAREHEDRARTTEPPPAPSNTASAGLPLVTAIPATPPNAPSNSLGMTLPQQGTPAFVAGQFAPMPSPLGDSRPLSSGSLGELQRAIAQERVPPPRAVTTDTIGRAPTSSTATGSLASAGALGRVPITSNTTKGRADSAQMPMVFGASEGARPLATAVATRFSGSLALVVDGVARRVVFQDGDVVTAASEKAEETLVSFLAERGDLQRDLVAKLQTRLPPSGRHAGAALIAQGHLAQDDLWPVLRAHAEWILCKALVDGPGAIETEDEPPGRLKAEPSVFGGATGAEVFVELMRRAVPTEISLPRLGGRDARLDNGARPQLLSECALSEAEQTLLRSAPSKRVGELLPDGESDLATVLWALVEMGVLTVHAAVREEGEAPKPLVDPLDEEALRSKVRARVALVKEGDYFSLLGVPRAATAYDIKRAYLELRRAYEPSRLLTAATIDLLDDLKLILEVLDEAFEILRDTNRRERYRRAIEASPLG